MAPAVLNDDVIFHVVSHLSVPRSKDVRQTLVQLAQVHSTFTKPALAMLWRSLPSTVALEHLLCVVGIAQQDLRNSDNHALTPLWLHGALERHALGWERFQEYSVLVREITLDPFFIPTVSSFNPENTFWARLTSTFRITSILPRLKVVTLSSSATIRFSSLNPDTVRFLGPSIQEFNVAVTSVRLEARTVVAQVFERCFSSVQDLDVISLQTPTPVMDLTSLPQLHPRLRQLMHLPAVQPADLSPLSSFQYLEHLSVSIRLDYSMLAALPNPIKLSRLHSLAVSTDQFSAISALVAAVEVPRLQSFSGSLLQWQCHQYPIHGELSNVLHLLVARCPALITFSWTSNLCQENEDRFRPGVLAELIAPLLSVRTIRNFSASFKGHVVSHAPSDFRVFAGAWPELETLELRIALHSNKTDVNAYADFESLVSFAHHCPRLRRLYIPKVKFDRPAAAAVVRPSAPHWLRSLVVETVILCEEQLEDEVFKYRLRTLRRLIQEVFPEAKIDLGM